VLSYRVSIPSTPEGLYLSGGKLEFSNRK
jgi:hypothetical protein